MKSATFSTGKPPLIFNSFHQSQMQSIHSKASNKNIPLYKFYDQLEILMLSANNFKQDDSTNDKEQFRRQTKKNLSINQQFFAKQGKNDSLILQYENALSRIQASLISKEFDINRKTKQFQIQVYNWINLEKIKQYEHQLQTLLSELQNKNKNLLSLEQKVGQLELQIQSYRIKNQYLTNCQKNLKQQYQQQSKQLNQLKKKMENKKNEDLNKQVSKQYEKCIKQLNVQIQKLTCQLQSRLIFYLDALNQLQIKKNNDIMKDKQIQDLNQLNIKLSSQIYQMTNDFKFKNQFKTLFEQSQRNLQENLKLQKFMENQIESLKKQNIKLTKKYEDLQQLVNKLQLNNQILKFEKSNLNQYNKVLINRVNSKEEILYSKIFGRSNSTFQTITN